MKTNEIICGDTLTILKTFPAESVDCVITSPPYWGLRDYGVAGQLGLEKTPEEYVAKMVEIFMEVKRVLKKEGTCWLNLGDSYNGGGRGGIGCENASLKQFTNTGTLTMPKLIKAPGLKPKDLVGIPWRVAFALQQDGWYLRQDIIWAKPNPMPESVTDRCTKSHEYIFLLAKSSKYYFDQEAIFEPANYDGRKDMMMKGSEKYKDGYVPNQSPQTMAARGHQRWRWKEDVADSSRKNYQSGRRTYGDNKDRNDNDLGERSRGISYAVRNRRSVWTITTKPFKEAHFATFPEDLIIPMVLAGCPKNGIILDPFMGSGTTAIVAKKLRRNWLGIELNQEYIKIAEARIRAMPTPLL